MKLNSFQLLLKQRYDTYEAVANLLRAAVSAKAFPDKKLTSEYYIAPLEVRIDREVGLPGTRGGLLWRYFVARRTWLADLDRVKELLGKDARNTVQKLERQSEDVQRPDGDESIAVILSALTSPGFEQYVQARFGEENTDLALKHLESYLQNPPPEMSIAETVDLLTHVFVQDFELADLAYFQPNVDSSETQHADNPLNTSVRKELARIAQSFTPQRQTIRKFVKDKLESDDILRSLVLSRLLPFVESHFLVINPQDRRKSDTDTDSLASLVIEQDYFKRFPEGPTFDVSRLPHRYAEEALIQQMAKILSHASVPFLYWCAQSNIPLARLWDEPGKERADKISIWPKATDRDGSGKHVAITSEVDKESFSAAMQVLTQALHRDPESVCLFVTDHWNEEKAVAAYHTNPRGLGSIVVLRSDGTRYPISIFAWPTQ